MDYCLSVSGILTTSTASFWTLIFKTNSDIIKYSFNIHVHRFIQKNMILFKNIFFLLLWYKIFIFYFNVFSNGRTFERTFSRILAASQIQAICDQIRFHTRSSDTIKVIFISFFHCIIRIFKVPQNKLRSVAGRIIRVGNDNGVYLKFPTKTSILVWTNNVVEV